MITHLQEENGKLKREVEELEEKLSRKKEVLEENENIKRKVEARASKVHGTSKAKVTIEETLPEMAAIQSCFSSWKSASQTPDMICLERSKSKLVHKQLQNFHSFASL